MRGDACGSEAVTRHPGSLMSAPAAPPLPMAVQMEAAMPTEQQRAAVTTERLRVMTYNVWFSDNEFTRRATEIFRIIWALDPDVVMLQEVLPKFLDQLWVQPWAQAAYTFSRSPAAYTISRSPADAAPADYFVLMLVRKQLEPVFSEHQLPSAMGRTLVKATMTVNGSPFDGPPLHSPRLARAWPHPNCVTGAGALRLHGLPAVATVHLESLNNAQRRREQLQSAAALLAGSGPALLAGDFNFGADRDYSALHRREAATPSPPATLRALTQCLLGCRGDGRDQAGRAPGSDRKRPACRDLAGICRRLGSNPAP